MRTEQGISKSAFARMCGISRPTLDKIEKCQANARLSEVQRISSALCVEPADLLAPCGGESKSDWLALWM